MSLLPPEKWRFCKLAPKSSNENVISNSNTITTITSESSPQTPISKSAKTFESSPSSSSSPTPPRINKNHGFLKHIIKNQIERDEYEKAIIQAREERNQQYQKISSNYITSPPYSRNFSSASSSPQLSPQLPIGNENDPYGELRARARRSLQREGIL